MSTESAPRARLLYIDDDPGLARLVQKDLARRGFDVSLAPNGDLGLSLLRHSEFDVVALDHYLPGRTGIEILQEINATETAPPVIYVTGTEEGRVAVAALKAGACDYVIKSASGDFLPLLGAAVEQALRERELARAKEEAERDMRQARERAEALLKEVNHRVGNSLQLVSTFVAMQADQIADPGARGLLKDTQSRIAAVAQIHRRLYTSNNVHEVELQDYLAGLVEELALSLSGGTKQQIELSVEPLRVPTDKAVSLGVIVTELVTNAFKYAYPPDAPGPVRVRMRRTGEGGAELSVEDDGIGWRRGSPVRGSGLGQKIIDAMATTLRTEVEFDPEHRGTRAVVRFAV